MEKTWDDFKNMFAQAYLELHESSEMARCTGHMKSIKEVEELEAMTHL